MRLTGSGSVLIIALLGSVLTASGQSPSSSTGRRLIFIPTLVQELHELRINTGESAVLRDGTMSAVQKRNTPSPGNTYLNFHVDVASEAGPFVLHANSIRLEGAAVGAATPRLDSATGGTVSDGPAIASYVPLDWFVDTGLEVRGDLLTVNDKASVQFTIEVPHANFEDLVLLVHSERIGTVREIRQRIAAGSQIQ